MSLCSQTVRAISRSRGPRPNTLLPFLYQTATIQQWNSATRPNSCRSAYTRSKPADDIPFADADGNLPPNVDAAQSTRKTTITDTERAAFEKLYKKFTAREHGQKQKREHEELDQIADEYYEDEEEQKNIPLDQVFEELLYGKPPKPSPQKKKQLAAKAENERTRQIHLKERQRIDVLLQNAETDRDLWSILDREVFDQLRKLKLDEPNLASKAKRSKPSPNGPKVPVKRAPPSPKALSSTTEAQILFANYPHHLVTASDVFRQQFPRSPLPYSLLPTIKALGRSSYALGATTKLYQTLIRAAWVQQSSYSLIDKLLTDMDTNIVDFDMGILHILDAVIREYDTARVGQFGKELQMVYGMESWREGIEKIKSWRAVVAQRLGVPHPLEANVGKPVREGTSEWRRKEARGTVREKRGREAGVRTKYGVSEDVPFVEGQQAEAERKSFPRELVEVDPQFERFKEEAKDEESGDRPAKVLL